MLAMGVFGYIGDYVLWWVLFVSLVVNAWCFFRFFPRAKHRKSGLVLGNVLIFLCMLGVAGLIGESYYRFLCVETDSFGFSLPAQRWFALHTRLNSARCRDREWSAGDRQDVRRVAFVGDSFTYGWGIERVEDRFSDRIQALFDRQASGTVEVMNVAKPGWSTGQEIQPIHDIIGGYGVDEIVLCYVANDIEELLPRTGEFDPIVPPQPDWFNPDSSCLLYHLHLRIVVPRVDTVAGYHDWLADGFADPSVWRAHQDELRQIITMCRQNGVTLRVALLPFIRSRGDAFRSEEIHARVRAFFTGEGIDVVDLLPTLGAIEAADLVVNGADAHPNELANQLMSDAIWKAFYAASVP